MRAFNKCIQLRNTLDGLPIRFYLTGDNAFDLSETLLTPFDINERSDDPHKIAYNYFLSQLRIRIEQAFGLLCSKWRIFRTDIEASTGTTSQYITAAARLHNYVLNNDGSIPDDQIANAIVPLEGAPPIADAALGYLPSWPNSVPVPTEPSIRAGPETAQRRGVILGRIRDLDLRRPTPMYDEE